jgi:hypothetical protein
MSVPKMDCIFGSATNLQIQLNSFFERDRITFEQIVSLHITAQSSSTENWIFVFLLYQKHEDSKHWRDNCSVIVHNEQTASDLCIKINNTIEEQNRQGNPFKKDFLVKDSTNTFHWIGIFGPKEMCP